MAQTTSPDNIPSPDLSDQYALTQDMANMADATQNALIKRANSYIGTSSQRTAWTTAPVGTLWSDTTGDRLVWKKGATSWEEVRPKGSPFAMAAGSVSVPGGSGSTTSASITYPPGRFSQPPVVTFVASSGVPGAISGYPSVTDRTVTGCKVNLVRTTATSTTVYWTAVQMLPNSAEG